MVSRDAVIKYGTLAIILFFVIESFFPLLYSSQQHDVASPTPAPISFQGNGSTTANVTSFGYVGYAECAADATRVDELLQKRPDVKTAFYAASGALALEFFPNASLNEIAALVLEKCGVPLFRSAMLDLSPVRLTPTAADKNMSQVLLTKQHLQSFAAQSGMPYLRGFVYADTPAGKVVNVSVFGVISDVASQPTLQRLTVQEVRVAVAPSPTSTTPSPSQTPSPTPSLPPQANESAASPSPIVGGKETQEV